MSHLFEIVAALPARAQELGIDDTSRWVLVAASFAGTSLLVWLAGRRMNRQPSPIELRIAKIGGDDTALDKPNDGPLGGLAPALAAQIPESKKERKDFDRLLRGAGIYSPHAAVTLYAMRFLLLVLPLLAAGVLAILADRQQTIKILLIGAAVAAALSIVPRLYVFVRRRRRLRRIRNGLPDTLDMLGMCVGSGLGVSQSLDHVASQLTAYPDVAQELLILKRQAEVSSLEIALADLAERIDLAEVRQLASLLTRGDRLGTKLAGSLLTQADHLRVTRKQSATLRANKTPVKLVLPLLFCFAPAALIILTGPAMLELKEFLRPTEGASVISGSAVEGISPSSIIRTLDDLNQDIEGS
ncbi:MAG: type II secretion system F family protein [Pirellulales bacterium]|nr:type II secretion system F family protein [Pirellulales bacterium]